MKKKWQRLGSNSIDKATTTSKDWGFKPVPNKGGKTTNSTLKEDNKNA